MKKEVGIRLRCPEEDLEEATDQRLRIAEWFADQSGLAVNKWFDEAVKHGSPTIVSEPISLRIHRHPLKDVIYFDVNGKVEVEED